MKSMLSNFKADHPVAFVISLWISCVDNWIRDIKGSLGEQEGYKWTTFIFFVITF